MTDISKARNLGPVTQDILKQLKINSLEELKKRDPVDVYMEMQVKGYFVTRNMLWGLYGAIEDIDWREIPDKVRVEMEAKVEDSESKRNEKSLF